MEHLCFFGMHLVDKTSARRTINPLAYRTHEKTTTVRASHVFIRRCTRSNTRYILAKTKNIDLLWLTFGSTTALLAYIAGCDSRSCARRHTIGRRQSCESTRPRRRAAFWSCRTGGAGTISRRASHHRARDSRSWGNLLLDGLPARAWCRCFSARGSARRMFGFKSNSRYNGDVRSPFVQRQWPFTDAVTDALRERSKSDS
jgi:hypothetical protein